MRECRVSGCEIVPLSIKGDDRGSLIAVEAGRDVPFPIARIYYVFDTKAGVDRGFHAHRNLRQMLVAVSGGCTIMVDDAHEQDEVRLDDPSVGLKIEGLVWRQMTDFTPDCVLLVLADAPYDEADYIRDHREFLATARAGA